MVKCVSVLILCQGDQAQDGVREDFKICAVTNRSVTVRIPA